MRISDYGALAFLAGASSPGSYGRLRDDLSPPPPLTKRQLATAEKKAKKRAKTKAARKANKARRRR